MNAKGKWNRLISGANSWSFAVSCGASLISAGHHSYLMASMGSSMAAFLAGYHPKKMPVKEHTAKLMMMPKAVRNDRILLAAMARTAILNKLV